MPRPNFSTSIALQSKRTSSTSPSGDQDGLVADGRFAQETILGVSRRKPKGWLVPMSYSMTYRKWDRAVGRSKVTVNLSGAYDLWEGCIGGQPLGRFNSLNHFDQIVMEGSVYDNTLSNSALTAARIKMKQADINLGVAWAERDATARMLGTTASNIGRAFMDLKHGDVRGAMDHLGISSKAKLPKGSNVPNKWLELQYGWKPLLSDVYGACKALEREPKADWRVTAKAMKKSKGIWTKTWTMPEDGLGVAEAERSNYTRIDALPGNELIGSLNSLGVLNPALIAWELVPFSFVVDWALPIGTWLDSLDALLGFKDAYTSSSTLTKCRWEGKGIRKDYGGGYVVDNDYLETKKLVSLVRTASSGVPLPTFPRIKNPASLGHMANGLSLLASAFGSKR